MDSTFHDRANISKRDACNFWSETYKMTPDCDKYANGMLDLISNGLTNQINFLSIIYSQNKLN